MSDTTPIEHPSWLTSGDFTAADEPFRLFAAWLEDATAAEPRDPTAMTLATVDADGLPNARMVLLKGVDAARIRLLHQHGQPKGARIGRPSAGGAGVPLEIAPTGRCACAGRSSGSPTQEADAYFATRPKQAQIGAWASKQSAPLESRLAFEKAVALYAAKYAIGAVPRPPHWSGYRIVPLQHRILAGPAVPPARPHRVQPRSARRAPGARRGFIRELALATAHAT